MSIQVGQKAPDFTLFDSDKNKVSLSAMTGSPVVILFFPLAFTGVCTKELCSVRDNIATYNQTNAKVIGISVDSLFTLAKFKEDQQLNFTLLSDFNGTAASSYGVLYDVFPAFEMEKVSKRAAFVVDAEGVVRYAEVCATPGDLPNFAAIQETLAGLA
ncbi:MAG: redoxin domain-containing protein [Bacteroidota bacterium]|nr:redoxin domain-containing protein [Sediminibacterium sp.]